MPEDGAPEGAEDPARQYVFDISEMAGERSLERRTRAVAEWLVGIDAWLRSADSRARELLGHSAGYANATQAGAAAVARLGQLHAGITRMLRDVEATLSKGTIGIEDIRRIESLGVDEALRRMFDELVNVVLGEGGREHARRQGLQAQWERQRQAEEERLARQRAEDCATEQTRCRAQEEARREDARLRQLRAEQQKREAEVAARLADAQLAQKVFLSVLALAGVVGVVALTARACNSSTRSSGDVTAPIATSTAYAGESESIGPHGPPYKFPPTLGAPSRSPGEPKATCATCLTQEEFDAVYPRKCCPVTACVADSQCPPSRVCCSIPNGQLCVDRKRCLAGYHVQAVQAAPTAARAVSGGVPAGGCVVEGVVYDADGNRYSPCEGGGNACMFDSLPGGCKGPRKRATPPPPGSLCPPGSEDVHNRADGCARVCWVNGGDCCRIGCEE